MYVRNLPTPFSSCSNLWKQSLRTSGALFNPIAVRSEEGSCIRLLKVSASWVSISLTRPSGRKGMCSLHYFTAPTILSKSTLIDLIGVRRLVYSCGNPERVCRGQRRAGQAAGEPRTARQAGNATAASRAIRSASRPLGRRTARRERRTAGHQASRASAQGGHAPRSVGGASPNSIVDKLVGRLEEFVRNGRPIDFHSSMSSEQWTMYQDGMRDVRPVQQSNWPSVFLSQREQPACWT